MRFLVIALLCAGWEVAYLLHGPPMSELIHILAGN